MIGFGFTPDWLRKWHEFFNQSESLVMQNQSKHNITFDTQLKTALISSLEIIFFILMTCMFDQVVILTGEIR